MKLHSRLLFPVAMVLFAGVAIAQKTNPMKVYQSPSEIVLDAIQNNGAVGLMQGDLADDFKRKFNAKGRLQASATIIKSFKQIGCKRVKVVYVQHEAHAREGITKVSVNTEINYCLDGQPPKSIE